MADNKAMYSFQMIWRFDAPIDRVWEMINHPEQWPTWWKNGKNVKKVHEGDGNGVGAVRQFTMQTQLPYKLVFDIRSTRSEKPRLLAGDAEGNLAGADDERAARGPEIFLAARKRLTWYNRLYERYIPRRL